MRFICVFVLAAVLVGVLAPVAGAGGYTDLSYLTPIGTVGRPYSHRVEWKPGNGCPPYSYAVVGGEMPPGLSLSSSGDITGTPTRAGTYSSYIRQTDQCGPEGEGNSPFRITIVGVMPTVEVRTPFSASLDTLFGATSGAPLYRYAPVSGFPFGVGLDPIAGTIFGSPRRPGTLTLTILAIDANQVGKQVTLPLVVVPKLQIATAKLPRGHVGETYRAEVAVTGGKTPAWRISSGALPAGLKINPSTGAITGVPLSEGVSRFIVSVRDPLGAAVSIRYTLRIAR